jgi:hypothetical protein
MFDVSSIISGNPYYRQLLVLNRDNIQKKRIVEIMTKEDFIFIEPSPSDETIMKSLSSGNSSLSSSPLYSVGFGAGVESPDQQANIIANEVYGLNVSSFQELHILQKKMRRRNDGRKK